MENHTQNNCIIELKVLWFCVFYKYQSLFKFTICRPAKENSSMNVLFECVCAVQVQNEIQLEVFLMFWLTDQSIKFPYNTFFL